MKPRIKETPCALSQMPPRDSSEEISCWKSPPEIIARSCVLPPQDCIHTPTHGSLPHWVRLFQFACLSPRVHHWVLQFNKFSQFLQLYILSICYVLWGQIFIFESTECQSHGRCWVLRALHINSLNPHKNYEVCSLITHFIGEVTEARVKWLAYGHTAAK